jgi:hypothetical protein
MRLGVAWGGQVQDALGAWFKSLEAFPPRQKGGTLTPNSSHYQADQKGNSSP